MNLEERQSIDDNSYVSRGLVFPDNVTDDEKGALHGHAMETIAALDMCESRDNATLSEGYRRLNAADKAMAEAVTRMRNPVDERERDRYPAWQQTWGDWMVHFMLQCDATLARKQKAAKAEKDARVARPANAPTMTVKEFRAIIAEIEADMLTA